MNRFQIGLVLLAIVVVFTRFYFFFHNQVPYKDGEVVSLETTLLSEPAQGRFNQRITLQTQKGLVQLSLPKYPQYHYGQYIQVSGKIITRSSRLTMNFPKITVKESRQNLILAVASFVRQKMISLFHNSLSSPSSSLLLGIVFGIKEPIDKEFADAVRTSGVMHVVAASGMNVTMVLSFISPILLFFLRRQTALVLAGLFVILYALVAGLQASIIRASIMGIFVLVAQVFGRQTIALYGLFAAGFLMLVVSPQTLFDIGFQLSFLSTLGLLFIRPLFSNVILGNASDSRIDSGLARMTVLDDITTTLSAQIATLPILLSNFGSYSPISIIANGLVLWTIPILMAIGGVGGLVGLIFEPLGRLILYISLPLLIYFENIVVWLGKHFGMFEIENFPWQLSVGYYLILTSLVLSLRREMEERAKKK